MKELTLIEMKNRIDVLESAVTYCLTSIKEIESKIQAQEDNNIDIDTHEVDAE